MVYVGRFRRGEKRSTTPKRAASTAQAPCFDTPTKIGRRRHRRCHVVQLRGATCGRDPEHHSHWCASRHLENLSEDGRIIAVLEFMKRAGFRTLSMFIEASFFGSDGSDGDAPRMMC